MKKTVISIFIAATLFACKQKDKEVKGGSFTINGKIEGAETGEAIVLHQMMANKKPDTAIIAKDGSFSFKGTVDEPMIGAVYFPSTIQKDNQALTFFIEGGSTELTGKKNELNVATVKGGESNTDLKKVEAILNGYYKKMKVLGDSLYALKSAGNEAALKPLESQYMKLEEEQKSEVIKFIKDHPKSHASAFFAYQFTNYGTDPVVVENVYNSLDTSIQTTFYAKKLKNVVDALKASGIGNKAPDFALQTPDGKTVSLSSFKGKYVLLDFWASWCGPCRQENPNVVKAFNQFKDKNFTILGVSLDEDKTAWQNAIMKDGLTWQHVSDLKGWQSSVAGMYSVQSIPANFLIDIEGKIIAKDLRGEQLESKLREVLR